MSILEIPFPCSGALYNHLGRAGGSTSICNSCSYQTALQTVSVEADVFEPCMSSPLLLVSPSCLRVEPSTIPQKCSWSMSKAFLHLVQFYRMLPNSEICFMRFCQNSMNYLSIEVINFHFCCLWHNQSFKSSPL